MFEFKKSTSAAAKKATNYFNQVNEQIEKSRFELEQCQARVTELTNFLRSPYTQANELKKALHDEFISLLPNIKEPTSNAYTLAFTKFAAMAGVSINEAKGGLKYRVYNMVDKTDLNAMLSWWFFCGIHFSDSIKNTHDFGGLDFYRDYLKLTDDKAYQKFISLADTLDDFDNQVKTNLRPPVTKPPVGGYSQTVTQTSNVERLPPKPKAPTVDVRQPQITPDMIDVQR